jgi:CMP-N-acetylneuraminic acid synthetase
MIPARGRNDGVEHMNMREFGSHPLIYFTIALAQGCEFVDRVIVSTEDAKIAEYATSLGVDIPFLRKQTLADVDAEMEDIVQETVNFFSGQGEHFDYLLNLYPNTPFKSQGLLYRFLDRLDQSCCDLVIPLFAHQNFFWQIDGDELSLAFDKERQSRRRAVKKYEELGGIYAHNLKTKRGKKQDQFKLGYCELTFNESRTITSVYDMLLLERLTRLPQSLIDDILLAE